MFPQFGATAETLSKASSMVFRIGTDAHLYDFPEDVNIAPLLDSKFDSEKCEALKRLLALIAQGFDVSNYFPQVVKNVACQSLDVKKLVYLYLLHYAEKRPNEALLSINCFQKDLGDPNPLVRAWALRTMAGIRLHVIAPLVLVAVQKCAKDPSVYVRKCAANALPKLHDLQLEEQTSAIEELAGTLLNDRSPGVVGAAAAAFASICPNNFSLIGRNYRRLCEILPDVEEWGQIVLIGTLLRYVVARHGLVQESIMFSLHSTDDFQPETDEFGLGKEAGDEGRFLDAKLANMVSKSYIEGPDEYLSRSSFPYNVSSSVSREEFTSAANNDDVKILLQCTSPLLWSNNSAVILAAAGVHWIMAPLDDVKRIVKPLLFALRSSDASKYLVLCNIQVFAKAMPSLFAPHFEDFFICSSDAYQVKALKLEILSSVATDSSFSSIFKEFEDYIGDPDRRFAADTIAAIGLCAKRLPKMPATCLDGLLALTRQEIFTCDIGSADGEAGVLIQAILTIQTIIKQDPSSHEKVIAHLVCRLDSIKVPAARAIVIWMVGTYCSVGHIIAKMLTTVLRYLAWSFKSEATETKLQILNTTAKVLSGKVVLCAKEDFATFRKVFTYMIGLAECDLSYDVRDRARFLKKLVPCNLAYDGPEEATSVLSQTNVMPRVVAEHVLGIQLNSVSSEAANNRFYLPGSLSQIVLHAAPCYEPLPKPCSFIFDDLGELSDSNKPRVVVTYSGSDVTDDSQSFTGSMDEDGSSDYGSQSSTTASSGSDDSKETSRTNNADDSADPLIQISDVAVDHQNQSRADHSGAAELEELMSKRSLELWLEEQQPGSSVPTWSGLSPEQNSSARISIGDIGSRVRYKSYSLLQPSNGKGLKVDYSFSSKISMISPQLVCVEVSFENCSSEPILNVNLKDEESNTVDQTSNENESMVSSDNRIPTLVPAEEIDCLEPGQTAKSFIQVHFHHHLLPLKLALHYNDKKVLVKLRPDIGYFVKPLPMSIEAFLDKESHLPGMFEYTRRCTFADHLVDMSKECADSSFMKDKFLVICESIALKMLSNANLSLVSVDLPVAAKLDDATGLCLRFSGEILSNGIPCLVTATVEGKCSEQLNMTIKVNCEETVFGLNLLNRIVNFLVQASSSNF